jgi:hypothetical protein
MTPYLLRYMTLELKLHSCHSFKYIFSSQQYPSPEDTQNFTQNERETQPKYVFYAGKCRIPLHHQYLRFPFYGL